MKKLAAAGLAVLLLLTGCGSSRSSSESCPEPEAAECFEKFVKSMMDDTFDAEFYVKSRLPEEYCRKNNKTVQQSISSWKDMQKEGSTNCRVEFNRIYYIGPMEEEYLRWCEEEWQDKYGSYVTLDRGYYFGYVENFTDLEEPGAEVEYLGDKQYVIYVNGDGWKMSDFNETRLKKLHDDRVNASGTSAAVGKQGETAEKTKPRGQVCQ